MSPDAADPTSASGRPGRPGRPERPVNPARDRPEGVTRPLHPDSPKNFRVLVGGLSSQAPGSHCVASPGSLSQLHRGVPPRVRCGARWYPPSSDFFPSVGRLLLLGFTLDSGSWRGVTNRWDGEAESQWIVAARLLYHLQYLVPYLSRLQRIHLPDRLKLNAKRPRRDVPPARGSSRHMLLGAHARPY